MDMTVKGLCKDGPYDGQFLETETGSTARFTVDGVTGVYVWSSEYHAYFWIGDGPVSYSYF